MTLIPGGGGGPTLASIVAEVEQFKGDRYVYGGTSPSGFDCSGLVQYVLEHVGLSNVPRTSEAQWAWVQQLPASTPQSQLQPGYLVFAQFPGDNASPGHVGVYVGNGQVLSAEDPALGVGYSSLQSWSGNIVGYGIAPGTAGTPAGSPSSPSPSTGGLPSGLLSGAANLLHAVAVVLDRAFGLFMPGQAWRIVFGISSLVLAFMAYRVLGGPVSVGGLL